MPIEVSYLYKKEEEEARRMEFGRDEQIRALQAKIRQSLQKNVHDLIELMREILINRYCEERSRGIECEVTPLSRELSKKIHRGRLAGKFRVRVGDVVENWEISFGYDNTHDLYVDNGFYINKEGEEPRLNINFDIMDRD
jgi:hypothetical protein